MRKILAVLGLAALALLASCGNGSSTNTPGGPNGGNNAGYSNSSLNGTYVFSASGVYNSGYSFDTAGTFTADGNGKITGGVRDIYSDGSQHVQNENVTGTYSVSTDGRGQVQLRGSSGTTTYRFVLHSANEGAFFQYSASADSLGRFVKQSGTPGNLVSGAASYVLRLDGENASGAPYGAVGLLTSSGGNLSGTLDENDSGSYSAMLAAGGTIAAPDGNGRGTLTLNFGSTARSFVYYYASPNEVALLSTDSAFQYGSLNLQTGVSGSTAAFTGGQVFALTGYYAQNNYTYPMAETGRFTLDGAGNVASAVEDNNIGGSFEGNLGFSGTMAADATGRWTASLTGVPAANMVGYQISPAKSMVLVYNTSASILETGVLQAQSSSVTTASIAGNYAVDLSGYSYYAPGNVESTANYLSDGAGNLSGTMDSQTPGFYNTDITQTGQYAINTSGRSTATFGAVPAALYVVDANTAYIISSDSYRLYQGTMVKQQ